MQHGGLGWEAIRAVSIKELCLDKVARLRSTALYSLQSMRLPLLVSQEIDNRFRLSHLIKSGGRAVVYEAEDRRLPRTVAVKILLPELSSNTDYLTQFNHEAEMAARLHHPHIVKMIDYGNSSIHLENGTGTSVITL